MLNLFFLVIQEIVLKKVHLRQELHLKALVLDNLRYQLQETWKSTPYIAMEKLRLIWLQMVDEFLETMCMQHSTTLWIKEEPRYGCN